MRSFVFAAALLLVPGTCLAQTSVNPTDKLIRGEFTTFDADGDGVVSEAEFRNGSQRPPLPVPVTLHDLNGSGAIDRREAEGQFKARLRELDRDADRALSFAEFANLGFGDADTAGRVFVEMDIDADGAVSEAEFVGRAKWELKLRDRNRDGRLTGEDRAAR